MKVVSLVVLAVFAALAVLFLRPDILRFTQERDRAVTRAAEQLGPRAAELAAATFWLVSTPAALDLVRAGHVPTFAEGAGALATPIDRRGYFLTAAHGVYGDTHVYGRFNDRMEARKARIVYLGGRQTPADDFCVLHVEGPLASAVPVASVSASPERDLFCVVRTERDRVLAAGRIKKRFPAAPDARGTFIETDFALHGGDSGGPLFNRHGQLIGVTSGRRGSEWLDVQLAGIAACPNPAFLADVIRRDQLERPSPNL